MIKNRSGRPPSQRQLRVGEQIRQVLSDCIYKGDLYDLNLTAISVTITEVSVSPDLRNAVVYAIPLGDNDGGVIIKALNRNSKHFKHYVAKMVDLRVHPRVSFKLDTSFDYAEEIGSLLHKTRQKDISRVKSKAELENNE